MGEESKLLDTTSARSWGIAAAVVAAASALGYCYKRYWVPQHDSPSSITNSEAAPESDAGVATNRGTSVPKSDAKDPTFVSFFASILILAVIAALLYFFKCRGQKDPEDAGLVPDIENGLRDRSE